MGLFSKAQHSKSPRGGLGFRVQATTVHTRSHSSCCSRQIATAIAMAAATIHIATATTARFAALSSRAPTNFSRNGAASRLAAPAARSASIFCTFAAFSAAKRNAALLARAADVGNGEVATEEVAAPVAEEGFGDVATEAVEAPVAEVQQQGSKLYVGNLPWTCDSEQLAEICMEIGAVEAVEVIYEQETGRSRGFAFVKMASNEDARAVISALDGTDLGGRALRVNFPKLTKNNPRVFNTGRKRPGNLNKMFVGNLPWACDEEALSQLFSDHGKVVEAKVVYDKETGRSRGFGFVTMDIAAEVDTAIENLNGTLFEGRLLRVDKVENKSPPRQD